MSSVTIYNNEKWGVIFDILMNGCEGRCSCDDVGCTAQVKIEGRKTCTYKFNTDRNKIICIEDGHEAVSYEMAKNINKNAIRDGYAPPFDESRMN